MAECYRRRPRILLGVTGSVAAVKGPKLALRLANELKADVKVVLTRTVEQYFWKEGRAVSSYDVDSWREFNDIVEISPLISSEDSIGDDDWKSSSGSISIHYAEEEWASYKSLHDSVRHIDLRNWADICLIAPLSAHTLAKIANGMCDDLLSCCLRAWDYGQRQSSLKGKQVILAPAMNTAMWDHPLTRQQLETIKKFSKDENGVVVVEPAVKTLACGEIGAGALAELNDIISTVKKSLVQWETDASTAQENHKHRKESMKHAILQYSKQRFSEMKISNEQQNYVAPISPTPSIIIETVLPHLNLDSSSLFVDLGCGDGRWLLAANKHTQCKCLGIDVDEERLKIANDSIRENNLQEKVQVRQQDVFDFVRKSNDFYKVNVIVMYLFRDAMLDMSSLLQQRLDLRESVKKDKMQILCVGFKLPGWTCIVHEEKVNDIRVYLYEI